MSIINYWVDYISEFFFDICHSIENHGHTWEIFTLQRAADRPLSPHHYGTKRARILYVKEVKKNIILG